MTQTRLILELPRGRFVFDPYPGAREGRRVNLFHCLSVTTETVRTGVFDVRIEYDLGPENRLLDFARSLRGGRPGWLLSVPTERRIRHVKGDRRRKRRMKEANSGLFGRVSRARRSGSVPREGEHPFEFFVVRFTSERAASAAELKRQGRNRDDEDG